MKTYKYRSILALLVFLIFFMVPIENVVLHAHNDPETN